jgi:hypothetical protein
LALWLARGSSTEAETLTHPGLMEHDVDVVHGRFDGVGIPDIRLDEGRLVGDGGRVAR